MKINADVIKLAVESRTIASPGARRNNTAEPASIPAEKPPDPSLRWISDRQSGERRMVEALSIAQMAQNVLQRAVEISSRLRNMAMDAMASRRVDYAGIAGVSAELSAALGEYAEKFGMAMLPVAALDPQPEGGTERAKAPHAGIGAALREMSEYAANMNAGMIVDTARFDGLLTRLQDGFAATEKTVALLTRRGLDMAREYAPGGAEGELAGVRTVVQESINRDSNAALIAQGNINRETIAGLLQA
ncbi:MAG: hypothetical protein MUC76_00880 [Spirochaetes bacterium]|jgi:hypothetical protein|nr:hypothetical protein [Spirochaetota bacterium]